MRILVTGANGMLGSTLVPILREAHYEVYPTDIDASDKAIEYLDVRDRTEVLRVVKKLRPHIVIHLAAKTDLERCDLEKEDAYLTNALGARNVALACKENGSIMVYISTAGVFDGTKQGPYTELDEPNPINVYGKTKFLGELFVKGALQKFFIIRAGWMMGGGIKKDKKFVGKIIQQLNKGKKELMVVTDKIGSPTYTVSFSKNLLKLIQTNDYGIYHMVCEGYASRFDVAKKVLEYLNRADVKLIPVTSKFLSEQYFVQRPPSEWLENYMLKTKGLNIMPRWEIALKEYCQVLKTELERGENRVV